MNITFKLKNILAILLFTTTIFFITSCGSKTIGQTADSLFLVKGDSSVFYELKSPDEKHSLPFILSEISGLAYNPNGNLLAVDDETGKVFEYSTSTREIVRSVTFSNSGDYEGVEMVKNSMYVLESDGDIYSFENSDRKREKSKKHESDLSRENDTEGLGYDPSTNSLLIVCKEKGEVKGNKAKGRSVYSFNLESKELSKEPLFSISSKQLKEFWGRTKNQEYDEGKIKFKPSAIAVHPLDQNYYLLSSVGKLLVVVDRSGAIQGTYPISKRVLTQPEGLCFAPNGDMFISSEGDGDRGYILKFSMNKK